MGRFTPGDHLDLLVEEGEGEVRRGAAEHVGEHEDARAGVHALHRLGEAHARVVHGGLGPHRHGLALLEATHDALRRAEHLLREPSVRGDDESDHLEPLCATAFRRRGRTIAASRPRRPAVRTGGYSLSTSRCQRRTGCPPASSRSASAPATATERCFPPVQPIATVR